MHMMSTDEARAVVADCQQSEVNRIVLALAVLVAKQERQLEFFHSHLIATTERVEKLERRKLVVVEEKKA